MKMSVLEGSNNHLTFHSDVKLKSVKALSKMHENEMKNLNTTQVWHLLLNYTIDLVFSV